MDRVAFLARLTSSVRASELGPVPAQDGGLRDDQSADSPSGHLVRRLLERASAAGVEPFLAASEEGAVAAVKRLVRERGWRRVTTPAGMSLSGAGGGVDTDPRDAEFGLEVAAWAVADTGSVITLSGAGADRRRSLLPAATGFLVSADHILPTLGDALRLLERDPGGLPSCCTVVTGPSSTGDIAGHHIVGAHGPAEVFVWVIAPETLTSQEADGRP
jgi:L-lactate utilization protein LutB